ncbi:hypothetical protein [Actinoplanes sp. NPDC026670]|uniref:hypothetical protein n=1 Tax=Actinoplanes sp. NPDC026670 TaxID=3154700 RepID=UPI0033FE3076
MAENVQETRPPEPPPPPPELPKPTEEQVKAENSADPVGVDENQQEAQQDTRNTAQQEYAKALAEDDSGNGSQNSESNGSESNGGEPKGLEPTSEFQAQLDSRQELGLDPAQPTPEVQSQLDDFKANKDLSAEPDPEAATIPQETPQAQQETPDPLAEQPDPLPETPDPLPETPDPLAEQPDPLPETPDPLPENQSVAETGQSVDVNEGQPVETGDQAQNAAGENGSSGQGDQVDAHDDTANTLQSELAKAHEGGDQNAEPEPDQSAEQDLKATPIEDRMDVDPETTERIQEMRAEGHGVQRHLDSTDQQAINRLGEPVRDDTGAPELKTSGQVKVEDNSKIDPMTGSNTDGVSGGEHKCAKETSTFDSAEDYAAADAHARELLKGETIPVGEFPISDVLGEDGHERIKCYTLDPQTGDPQRVDLEGGSIKAVYEHGADGKLHFVTMYAMPKAS